MNDLNRRRALALGGGMVLLGMGACGGGGDDGDAGGGSSGGGGGDGGTGGGGGTTPGTGSPSDFAGNGAVAAGTPGAAVSATQRTAALAQVTGAVTTLLGASLRLDALTLARQLQGMTAFQRVGISSRGQNVWATFTDGRSLVVPNNLTPAAATADDGARPLATTDDRRRALAGEFDMPSLLTAQQYRQLDMLGQVPAGSSPEAAHLCADFVSHETLPALRRMAVGLGFTLPAVQTQQPPDQGFDNGIEGLRNIADDGVFFITTIGAQIGNDELPRTALCTATPADAQAETVYASALDAGAVVYAVQLCGVNGTWQALPRLAITPDFARSVGWRFANESLGILNVSGATPTDWVSMLRASGLRHVMGWERPVSWQRLLAFADDLIQLSLGTNNLDGRVHSTPREPRLRNYGIGEALAYLMTRGLVGGNEAYYLQERSAPLLVNTLLPTITYALIREGGLELELVGLFGRRQVGSQPGDKPRIAISRQRGNTPSEPLLQRQADAPLPGIDAVSEPAWNGDTLQTVLRADQLARGGYLQVFNGGRCSNVVPITHWQIELQAVTTVDELTLTVSFTLHLRADVRGWRLTPDGQTRNGQYLIGMDSTVDSRASYEAHGQIARIEGRTTTTVFWSGSGSVGNTQGGTRQVMLAGPLDWPSRRMSFTLAMTAGEHQQRTLVQRSDPELGLVTVSDQTVPQPAILTAYAIPPQTLDFVFDERWGLQAGQIEMTALPVSLLGDRMRRTRLQWAAVPADFPPERDYGGT